MQTENVIAWELIDAGASACWKIHYGPPCPCPSEGVKEKYMARMNRDRRNQISSLRSCTDKGRTNAELELAKTKVLGSPKTFFFIGIYMRCANARVDARWENLSNRQFGAQ